jgi:hypothetical protein
MNAKLLAALIQVESGGHDMAVGDGGLAIGPLQIHREVVIDVNQFAGTHYRHSQMTNRAIARKVCDLYLQRYARDKSLEHQARIWNGGPNGHAKEATAKYWKRVKRHL